MIKIINSAESIWPSLPYNKWKDTLDTLHMYMQIVGKVKLALCPYLNQWWEVAFYITPYGITTGRIPYKDYSFAVDFNFTFQILKIYTSVGNEVIIPLKPLSVATFYKKFNYIMETLDIKFSISPTPVEFINPIPFNKDDKHKNYDKEYVFKWWQIQLKTSLLLDKFRSDFRGKSSPVHFFWGSFDTASTRFSGKLAIPPKLNGVMRKIMQFSENEENFTFGFWPGDKRFPFPAFYTYLYPAPKGFETIKTGPEISYFNKNLSLCILPYEELRKVKNPEKEILNFLETTYKEFATLAKWNIKELKAQIPK